MIVCICMSLVRSLHPLACLRTRMRAIALWRARQGAGVFSSHTRSLSTLSFGARVAVRARARARASTSLTLPGITYNIRTRSFGLSPWRTCALARTQTPASAHTCTRLPERASLSLPPSPSSPLCLSLALSFPLSCRHPASQAIQVGQQQAPRESERICRCHQVRVEVAALSQHLDSLKPTPSPA